MGFLNALVLAGALAFFCWSAGGVAVADDSLPSLSQLSSQNDAADDHRSASNAANQAGHNAVNTGHGHMHHGHAMGPAGAGMVALGAMQVAQGLQGLLAADEAARLSGQNASDGNRLSDISATADGGAVNSGGSGQGGDSAVNATPTAATTSGSSPVATKIDPAILSSGPVGDALAAIQDEYGIPGTTFVNALAHGADPRDLLTNAPKNPLTRQEAMVAYAEAAAALASAAKPAEGAASKLTAASSPGSDALPEGGQSRGRGPASLSLRDRLNRELDDGNSADEPPVSPEIQAALATQEEQRLKANQKELNLFELVHYKYHEKELMMIGVVSKAGGVVGANGF